MREVVRLIAFAIVTFAITVLALLLSVPDFAQSVGRGLGLIPPDADAAVARVKESETTVRQYRPQLGSWVGLEGFPSETSVVFPIPENIDVIGGQLQLDLVTDLISHGDGLVRVLINDRERDAIVMEAGRQTRQLTFDLLPSDLALGLVTVSLDGDGTTNYGQVCPTNVTNLGAAIEILPSTSVMLELSEPVTDVNAKVVLAPDPLPLDGTSDVALSAWATQYLTRQGVGAEPAPPELEQTFLLANTQTPLGLTDKNQVVVGGAAGVAQIGLLKSATLPTSYGYEWPLPVAALSTDTETHTFRGSTRWDLDYKLADLPGGEAPGQLHLALRTSQLEDPYKWTLRVLLNGDLLHSATYEGTTQNLVLDVELPADRQRLVNRLSISLIDNSPNQGICRAGPEAAAQLLPETQFTPVAAPATDEQTVVAALAAAGSIGISAETQQAIGATVRAEGLLDLMLPLDIPVSFADPGDATIRIIQAGSIGDSPADQGSSTYYAFPATGSEDEPIVWTGAPVATLPAEAVGLAISW